MHEKALNAIATEKTITRYGPTVHWKGQHAMAGMESYPEGLYVSYSDHEAALAARDEQWRAAIEAKAVFSDER